MSAIHSSHVGRRALATVESQPASEIFIEKLSDGGAVEIDAKLHVVFVNFPGEVVDDLVVGIKTMPRVAAICAKLSNAADQNDRETRIKWSRTVTLRKAGGRAESDRTGMEVLVLGEESLGKPVPSVA